MHAQLISDTPIQAEAAVRLRTAIGRLSRRLRPTRAAREAGLTPTGSAVLLRVVRGGATRLSDLGAAEGLNPTMLSRVVGSLVESGLLARSSDPGDRRAAWVRPTASGRRLAERMRRERTDAVTAALGELSPDHRRSIAEALPALEALGDALGEARS